MQNKKTLLHRLLVIYITFFIVLVASIAHNLLTDFSRGASDGFELGESIAEKWSSGTPRMIYVLNNIRITETPECPQTAPAGQPGCELDVRVSKIDLHVEQDATGVSPLGLAFRSIGGSGWIYAMVMVCPLFYLAIIVLMFMIIHSLRRSIREERTLDRRNVWYLRTIGLLTIAVELIGNIVDWIMNRRAAVLLADSGFTVDTSFHFSYLMIIMGILILFAAEVFAIGQNLSEEQKLTI